MAMPTPIAAHSPPLSQAQSRTATRNGSLSDGAVQAPNVASLGDGNENTSGGADAIREGKEKAKAVMAASGVDIDGEVQNAQNKSPASNSSPANVNMQNGTSPSRKRSRSGSRLPSQPPVLRPSEEGKEALKKYLLQQAIVRDITTTTTLIGEPEKASAVLAKQMAETAYWQKARKTIRPAEIFGRGYEGYGNRATDRPNTVLEYPAQRKRPGGRRSRPLYISRKDRNSQSEQLEELVPVRLDIEYDKIKLRDTFTWNLHDRVTPTEIFTENLVEDFKLPPETAGPLMLQINREIQEQLTDFYPHVFIEEDALDPTLPYHAYKNDEMRILIKLNITIGQHTLVDQFEWEINNPLNSPEEFARQMSRDLSLSGEFTTAIAHSIREQSQMFTKSLYITGHPFDGRPVEDADIRESFLSSPLPSVFRPAQSAKDFTPYLYELNEVELERTELSILREQRRQKRSVNRRGGPALPDLKDRQRTVRTLIVSEVLPGASLTVEDSHLYKPTRSASGRGRRAAGRIDGGEDSEESESEESAPESPAPSQVASGTARTRGMRGAASAAQAAMRANLGRSATPEISTIHHHETRTSRRLGGFEREESVTEPTSLIIKLRLPKEKLRQLLQKKKQGTPSAVGGSNMLPPPSPAMQNSATPTGGRNSVSASPRAQSSGLPGSQQQPQTYPDGRVDAPPPSAITQPPVSPSGNHPLVLRNLY